MQPEILTDLARRLYELRATGAIVPFARVGIGDGSAHDDWLPLPRHCHDNVDIWVKRSPEYEVVRGWVVFDQTKMQQLGMPASFHFAAHSVIRTPDGRLLDITPTDISQPYPFIVHPGTTEEFDALRMEHQLVAVDHYPDILSV